MCVNESTRMYQITCKVHTNKGAILRTFENVLNFSLTHQLIESAVVKEIQVGHQLIYDYRSFQSEFHCSYV